MNDIFLVVQALKEVVSQGNLYVSILTQEEIDQLKQDVEQGRKDGCRQAEKQEPFGYFQLDLRMDAWVQNRDNKKGVPFFTAPPRKEWVGLNWDDIPDVFVGDIAFMQGAKWALAKLKEKNCG